MQIARGLTLLKEELKSIPKVSGSLGYFSSSLHSSECTSLHDKSCLVEVLVLTSSGYLRINSTLMWLQCFLSSSNCKKEEISEGDTNAFPWQLFEHIIRLKTRVS